MQFLFDHALGILCGASLILGVLTLQTRTQVHAVQETVNDSSRGHATSVAETVAQEFDNVLSEPQAWDIIGDYRCRLGRDADGHTNLVEVPTFVSTAASGVPVPGHVRYTLVATGDAVQIGDEMAPTYDLLRETDTGAGYSNPSPIARGLVDFDVTFRGRASEKVAGAPPLRFSQIAFEVAVGLPTIEKRSSQLNVARVSFVVRPPNLTTGT